MNRVGTIVFAASLAACGGHGNTGGGGGGGGGGAGGGGMEMPVKRVFITSAAYTGDLKMIGGGTDGLKGADAICNNSAHGAGLTGTFVAWLSSPSVDAIDRVTDVGPWYQVAANGNKVLTFQNKASLTSTPNAAIDINEHGDNMFDACVWTGTSTGGRAAGDTCTGFVSAEVLVDGAIGSSNTAGSWTSGCSPYGSRDSCSAQHSLYCLEQ